MTHSPDAVRETLRAARIKVPALRSVLTHTDGTQVFGFDVHSKDAIGTWSAIRAATERTGWYPAVTKELNWPDTMEIRGQLKPSDYLKAAGEVDLKRWFSFPLEDGGEMDEEISHGAELTKGFTVPFDTLSGKPTKGVAINLVPTTQPHEALAFLPFGGWNECPDDSEHIAIMRSWFDRFGAELVTMSSDVLEFQVARPPTTDAAALELAREQYAYCADIVEQGVESVGTLAGCLKGGKIWYFWWD